MAATVAEIERCAKLGHKGVLFTGEPQKLGHADPRDRHWDPLWAAAQAAICPSASTSAAATFDDDFTPERMQLIRHRPTNALAAISLFLDNGKQLVDLLFSGVLARFPELKVVSVESGIGFIPFVLEAADYTFEYSKVRAERARSSS